MANIIMAIAALCSIQIGAMGLSIKDVKKEQVECHQYFVKCLKEKGKDGKISEDNLPICIEERN